MTRYSSSCVDRIMRPEDYRLPFAEDDEDEDDFDDDDDINGFDGLSDFDDDDDGNQGDRMEVFRRQRSMSDCSTNVLDSGDDNRRDHHNQLERKRRASIKTSYNDLRESIPSLRGSKASRAVILQRAVECIEELVRLNHDHTHCVETLRRQNDILDSRVQELQRYVQRLDCEETSVSSCSPISLPSGSGTSGNGTLRLYPGSLSAGSSGSASSSLPVYRLLPHDHLDKSATCQGSQGAHATYSAVRVTPPSVSRSSLISSGLPSRTGTSPAVHLMASTSAISNPDFTGMNALSAAVSLVTSNHSAFSSNCSSSGSNSEPAQSSSQRSSPGCLSSSSLSNASSNQGSNFRNEAMEERSLVIDLPCVSDSDSSSAHNTSRPNLVQTTCASPNVRPVSPPSIFLTVPIRPTTVIPPADSTCIKSKQSHQLVNVLTVNPNSAFKPNDITKRRRVS